MAGQTWGSQPPPPPAQQFRDSDSPVALYTLSVLIPVIGLIWGLVWWTSGDTLQKREWGKIGCIVAAVVGILQILLLIVLGVLGYMLEGEVDQPLRGVPHVSLWLHSLMACK
jgi:hypothetical protein